MSEKRRTSRFFKIKKEEPEEIEVEEEVKEPEEEPEETIEEKIPKVAKAQEPEKIDFKVEADIVQRKKESEPLRRVQEGIYQIKGILKALDQKLEQGKLTPEKYEAKSKELKQRLAELYERKIEHELEI